MLNHDLIRHGMEFSRAIANRQYEVSPAGIVFRKQRAIVQGCFETTINGGDRQLDPNEVPVEFLDYLLKLGFTGVGGLATWYIAPFVNNITPLSTLTAATFDSVLNEFDAYDEATRQAFTVPASPTSGSYSNSAAPASFTADATVGVGAGIDIYGAGIMSASAKNATSGKIGPTSKFSGLRNVKTADVLTVQYTVTASSTG